MTRTYTAPSPSRVRSVRLEETYEGSHHWRVFITPHRYGADPGEITFCSSDGEQSEGYGIFRIEMAAFIAEKLTGTACYS